MNYKDVNEVFRPGKPVLDPEYLVGRDAQLKRISSLLKSGGQSPVITGARGIGKTSLGLNASLPFQPVIRTQCNIRSTFDNWAKHLMSKLKLDTSNLEIIDRQQIGKGNRLGDNFDENLLGSHRERKKWLYGEQLRPDLLYIELARLKRPLTILVDEFDRLPSTDYESIGLFADFLKLLANQSEEHQVRIIFMGVSSSARKLFSGHESIKRNISSFHLKRISQAAIGEFLLRASKRLGILFSQDVVKSFQKETMGFPHYLHLVGWNCVLKKTTGSSIQSADYRQAVDQALDELLGIDSRWDFIRNGNSPEGDAILMHIVAARDARIDIDLVLKRLDAMSYSQKAVLEALSALERQRVIRVPRDKHGQLLEKARLSIYDPEMLPFLAANFQRERYISNKQMLIDFPSEGLR